MPQAWWRLPVEDVTQRQAEGMFFPPFSSFPEDEKGWPFPQGQPGAMWQPGLTPAGLCVTPEWGKEGCCHGGLCEANSSRVKWEIFIPRVRLRAGQRLRAGELGYYTDTVRLWCAGRTMAPLYHILVLCVGFLTTASA
ncbi:unnamed protein product, partial [Gulo gulo]